MIPADQEGVKRRNELLHALHPSDCGEIRALCEGTHPSTTKVGAADLGRVDEFVARFQERDIYVGVATRAHGQGGQLKDCLALHALFADIDFKDFPSEADARAQLEHFALLPSGVVATGGGLHLYWLLTEPLNLENGGAPHAKRLLRALAEVVGADLASAEPARILRLPGTFNYKYTPPRRVVIEALDVARRYSLDSLQACLPSVPDDPPARESVSHQLTRETRMQRAREYLASEPTADEGQRGDDNTYKICCAVAVGYDLNEDDALAVLKEWNARCTPPWTEGDLRQKIQNAVHYATGSRGAKLELVLNRTDPITSARIFVSRYYTVDDTLTLRHQQGVFYRWDPAVNAFREYDENTVKAELWRFLERAFRWTPGKVPSRVPFQPQRARVDDVFAALCAVTNLSPSTDPPCWLDRDMGLEPSKLLAFSNGTLDVRTRVLHPKTPCFYTHNAVTFEYDAHPPKPTEFHRFLKSLWTDEGSGVIDEQSIATLQECFGYLLVGATRLQKIFMIIGPKRSGKGTIGRVLRQLLGKRNVCAPSLTSLGRSFGGQVLIDTTLAIISDARLKGRDTAVIVEELLSISGEDAKTISRKYLPDWTGMLKTRFLLLTNELPGIEDESGALASRFIVLALRNSFYEREDPRLFDRLEPELPGILAWALDGWDRLNGRGYFVSPVASAGLIRQFEELNSPVGAFLDEGCEVGPQYDEAQRDVFSAWSLWCADNGRDRPGTAQSFGRYLRSCLPQVTVIRVQKEGLRRWYWQGLRLTDQGRRAAGMGERQEQVNLRM